MSATQQMVANPNAFGCGQGASPAVHATPGQTIFVSVCKNQILQNLKRGLHQPVIRTSKGRHGKGVRVHTPFTFKNVNVTFQYEPDNPAPWGARVWLEITDAK